MRIRWSNGMVAYSSTDTWDIACVRAQVYWPEIVVRTTELRVMFRTTLRLVWNQRERGIGFQVFGFGAGLAWEPAGVKVNQ